MANAHDFISALPEAYETKVCPCDAAVCMWRGKQSVLETSCGPMPCNVPSINSCGRLDFITELYQKHLQQLMLHTSPRAGWGAWRAAVRRPEAACGDCSCSPEGPQDPAAGRGHVSAGRSIRACGAGEHLFLPESASIGTQSLACPEICAEGRAPACSGQPCSSSSGALWHGTIDIYNTVDGAVRRSRSIPLSRCRSMNTVLLLSAVSYTRPPGVLTQPVMVLGVSVWHHTGGAGPDHDWPHKCGCGAPPVNHQECKQHRGRVQVCSPHE